MGFEDVLKKAEEILLQGHKFPNGRSMEEKRDLKEMLDAVPLVVEAFGLAPKEQRGRVFYLARDIDDPVPYQQERLRNITDAEYCSRYDAKPVSADLVVKIKDIAKEGRLQDALEGITLRRRVSRGMLFPWTKEEYIGGSLQDPKRGCSSAICSNCSEPIAFCDVNCFNCHKNLIQAQGLPTIEAWEQMNYKQRVNKLSVGYVRMLEDVRKRGDWRSSRSPFNKEAPQGIITSRQNYERSLSREDFRPDLHY